MFMRYCLVSAVKGENKLYMRHGVDYATLHWHMQRECFDKDPAVSLFVAYRNLMIVTEHHADTADR